MHVPIFRVITPNSAADDCENLAECLSRVDIKAGIPDPIAEILKEKLRIYFVIGDLKKYLKEYGEDTKTAVRFSLRNLSKDGNILNIPLYLADEAVRLISLCF